MSRAIQVRFVGKSNVARAVNLLPKGYCMDRLHWATADDGNGNTFVALVHDLHPDSEQHVPVWVFIDGDNGWGKNVGEVALLNLKKADNGHFMS